MEKDNNPANKALFFSNTRGSLIRKDFYDLPHLKSVECNVLILTNVLTNEKTGCLRLTTYNETSYSNESHIGFIDYEELADCIKSLYYIKNDLLPSYPNVYTEVEYKTSDDVKIGAYFHNGIWVAYVYTKGYNSDSAKYLNSEDIDDFIDILEQAYQLIEDLIKNK